jgi:hypothetical protein
MPLMAYIPEVLSAANGGSGSATAALELAQKPTVDPRCLWCGPNIHAAYDRRIEPEVLLHGSPATILDRGAALDNKGDRGGPTLGRLFEGVSRERARCLRGIPLLVVGASP